MLNLASLEILLQANGIPFVGISNPDNTAAHVVIQFDPSATAQQRTTAAAILAAWDGLPLGLASVMTAGAKPLGVVGVTGKAFFPTAYRIFVRDATGVTTPPTVSLGTNAPTYNNLQAAVALTGWAIGDMQNFALGYAGRIKAILAPTVVYLNVTTAAIGTVGAVGIVGGQFFGDYLDL